MFLVLTITALISFIVYRSIFSAYFFMDDWYFLQISQANNLIEFIKLFSPIRYIPYRPLSQQLFFFSFQKLFGLNPIPYHLFIFIVHLINSFLVYKISHKILKPNTAAKYISLIYAVSAIHFVGLFSITGSYFTFGLCWFLLCFYYLIQYQQSLLNKYYLSALGCYFIGIFSAEINYSLPFIAWIMLPALRKAKKIIPFVFLIIINLLINKFWAGSPPTESFKFSITKLPGTLRWYLLRFLALPEGIKNGFPEEKLIIYGGSLMIVVLLGINIFILRHRLWKKRIEIMQYLLLAFISGLPFYFLADHLNPVYAAISFFFFLIILNLIIQGRKFQLITLIYIVTSVFAVNLLNHTHWTTKRSALGKLKGAEILSQCERFRQLGYVEITANTPGDIDELKITLQNNRAAQLLCHDDKLQTVYQIK